MFLGELGAWKKSILNQSQLRTFLSLPKAKRQRLKAMRAGEAMAVLTRRARQKSAKVVAQQAARKAARKAARTAEETRASDARKAVRQAERRAAEKAQRKAARKAARTAEETQAANVRKAARKEARRQAQKQWRKSQLTTAEKVMFMSLPKADRKRLQKSYNLFQAKQILSRRIEKRAQEQTVGPPLPVTIQSELGTPDRLWSKNQLTAEQRVLWKGLSKKAKFKYRRRHISEVIAKLVRRKARLAGRAVRPEPIINTVGIPLPDTVMDVTAEEEFIEEEIPQWKSRDLSDELQDTFKALSKPDRWRLKDLDFEDARSELSQRWTAASTTGLKVFRHTIPRRRTPTRQFEEPVDEFFDGEFEDEFEEASTEAGVLGFLTPTTLTVGALALVGVFAFTTTKKKSKRSGRKKPMRRRK